MSELDFLSEALSGDDELLDFLDQFPFIDYATETETASEPEKSLPLPVDNSAEIIVDSSGSSNSSSRPSKRTRPDGEDSFDKVAALMQEMEFKEQKNWRLYLLRAPKNILDACNMGDMHAVREILNRICTEDCLLSTPALTTDLCGRHHVYSLFQAMQSTHPDMAMVSQPTKLADGKIFCKFAFSGTKLFDKESDYLFYTFKFGGSDDATVVESAAKIRSAGKLFMVMGKGALELFLNAEMTRVSKVAFHWKIVDVKESTYTRLGDDDC